MQTATSLRLDGLSYGPWIGDTLRFDQYNAVHVWLPDLSRYVNVILCNLPVGMRVYTPKATYNGNTTKQRHATPSSSTRHLNWTFAQWKRHYAQLIYKPNFKAIGVPSTILV